MKFLACQGKKRVVVLSHTDMKAFTSILAMLATPALVSPVLAAEAPGALAGYLPSDGSLIQGAAVRTIIDPSLAPLNKEVVANFNKLPEEKKAELVKGFDPNKAMPYDEALFGDKAAYDKYMEAWKKTKIVPVGGVAMGLLDSGEKGIWHVHSVTLDSAGRTLPLTISALRYDATKNVWRSNNGELTATPFSADDSYTFGAQSGTEWNYEHADSLSKLKETVRVTKTTDGEAIYVYYRFTENSAISGMTIAQGEYMLRFPIVSQSAGLSRPGQK